MDVVFDIGATTMRVAAARGGQLDAPRTAPTPQKFDDAVEVFSSLVQEASGGEEVRHVAGGIPGSANLPDWKGREFPATFLENDAALAGLGEAVSGAGKGARIVAYVGVGTGVGGARIVDGKIDPTAHGFEPGHHIIHDGKTLEYFCGGASLEARMKKKPAEIDDPRAWDEVARFLAVGIHNLFRLWSPDVLVLGGGMTQKRPGIAFGDVMTHLRTLKLPFEPKVVPAALGDRSGLVGALAFLRQREDTERNAAAGRGSASFGRPQKSTAYRGV